MLPGTSLSGILRDVTPAKRTEEALRRAALAVSGREGAGLFEYLARDLAEILSASTGFIAVFADESRSRMRTLALHIDGANRDNLSYALEGTPCATVVGREFRFIASGARAEFPQDSVFRELGVESYAAFPLYGAVGEPLGLIGVMDREPMRQRDVAESVMKIFAVRATAEIERARAEAALRHSEERHRDIFNAAADVMVLRDENFRVVDVNAAFVAMTGFSRQDALGKDVVLGGTPTELDSILRERHRKVLAGEPVLIETQRVRKDGSRIEVELRCMPVHHQGKPHVLYITRDIGGRKRAEEALRASEEQYRSIFNAIADGLVLRDADFRVVDVNAAFVAMSGYSRDEVIGRDRVITTPPEEGEAIRALHRRALAGEAVLIEVQRVRKDGKRADIELRGIPVQHRGEPHVLYIGRDISERKRAEEALRASEEQYRSIFNAASDALVLRDAERRVVDVNPAFLAMSGYTREEVVNDARWIFARPEMSALAKEMHRRVIAGESVQFEVQGLRKDGSLIDVEMRAVPIHYRGKPHALGMARDITERKRADAERAQLEAQLRQAHKMEALGQLTGGIAHDFNNILTGIQGYSRLAAERPAAAADLKLAMHLEQVALACNRARELIQQMLVFSRGRRGEPRTVALAPVVRQAIRLLRPSLPSTLEIVPQLDAELPAALLDPVQAEQVLMNLCINARDALHGKGRIGVSLGQATLRDAVCASCRGRVGGEFVELAVADSGPGIAPEVMDRMFEPFFTTKDAGRGSGMGLSIVHGIVHEYGGHILVDSSPAGARFRVLFPAMPAPKSPDEPESSADAAPRPRLKGCVLLVDDEEMVVDFMRELLQGWGLEVTAVTGAPEARELFATAPQRFDLVLSDHTMPRMTGLELARALRAIRPALPVVLCSGYAEVIPEQQLREAGVELVQKPIDEAALLVALRKHL